MAKRAAIEMTDESLGEQSIKRLKSEIGETKQRLLTDLHDDYLRLIFKLLELNDLLALMQVSKRFQDPVTSVFASKYPTKEVTITFNNYSRERSEILVLKEMPLITPFLRYFGHSISKLRVQFDEKNPKQSLAIEKSVLAYCDGLKELELQNCRNGAFDAIETPFNSIEVFRFISGFLGGNISQFDKWFPKLRSLKISNATVANKYCIVETLPCLEHLDIKIGAASKKFSRENVDDAIRSNPQLLSFRLNNGCKPRDIRLVSTELKRLEKLDLWLHPENFQKSCKMPIKFKEVKQLILDIYDKNDFFCDVFDINSTNKFLLVCDKLVDLEVRCYYLEDKYIDFARKNNLTKLTLHVQYDGPSIKFLKKIASYWPKLSEITIQLDSVNADEVIQFISACKHLQRLNISDESENGTAKFSELTSKLSNEWKLVPMITKGPYFDFEHSIIRKSYVV